MRRLIVILLIAAILISAVVLRERVLTAMGEYLVADARLERAEAVVVLSGSVPDRALEALELYREGHSHLILLTRGALPSGYSELLDRGVSLPLDHEFNLRMLRELGVPKDSIVVLPRQVDSTYAESLAVKDYVAENDIQSILIVTSRYHTKRAGIIFRDTMERCGAGRVRVGVRGSRYDDFSPEWWWKHRDHLKQVALEYQALLYYYLFERKGC